MPRALVDMKVFWWLILKPSNTDLCFDALIFDCDGTLVQTGDMHFTALSSALSRQGITLARAWYAARGGLSRMQLLDELETQHNRKLDREKLISESVGHTVKLAAGSKPNEPVAEIARVLHSRVPMAVASNAEGEIVNAVLAVHGLGKYFDTVVTISDVTHPKPHPEIFTATVTRLKAAHTRTLVLEDSQQGLEAANAAGVSVLDVRDSSALGAFRSSLGL
ncbi:HAD superfamily hydrolase (TIGR01509 family) [Roseibium hamelinense]|uniref:HAD superfamily hydrolase (TIGR01509 family) n=1 Tax=Roseibium hamelinense TaxID=150831 RepID=A0A562SZ28_9HYPH|nr:HAD family phosphatase [Roseibium hamelinense]MTI44802.1 HAD family phosphatase [Roseibium hamelinense]TWI86006.1 HAD superfamily hydrolase (TIGR01509 family) [Roseibium hamelinense]